MIISLAAERINWHQSWISCFVCCPLLSSFSFIFFIEMKRLFDCAIIKNCAKNIRKQTGWEMYKIVKPKTLKDELWAQKKSTFWWWACDVTYLTKYTAQTLWYLPNFRVSRTMGTNQIKMATVKHHQFFSLCTVAESVWWLMRKCWCSGLTAVSFLNIQGYWIWNGIVWLDY